VLLAAQPADVVHSAGGWLFDQVMAGWAADVWLADDGDPRPLTILGARSARMATAAHALPRGSLPRTVAVAAQLCRTDPAVRACVANLLDRGVAEVRLWGEQRPADLDTRLGTVRHRLSVAARAFKGYALRAAGLPAGAVEATETFRGSSLPAPPSRTA
jgi:hypothetical protein